MNINNESDYHMNNEWSSANDCMIQTIGVTYCSKQVADRAVELLDNKRHVL